MAGPRPPDFIIKATTRHSVFPAREGRIGAAWQNENGSITLTLDPFVDISGREDLVITLFPNDGKPATATKRTIPPPPAPK